MIDNNTFTDILKLLPKESPIGIAFALASKSMPDTEVSALVHIVMMAIGKDANNEQEVKEMLTMPIEEVVMSFAKQHVADDSMLEFMGVNQENGTRPIMDMLGYITASAHKDLTIKEAFELVEKMQNREIPGHVRDFFSKMMLISMGKSGDYSSLADVPVGDVREMTRSHIMKPKEEEPSDTKEEEPSTPLPDNVVLFPGTKV